MDAVHKRGEEGSTLAPPRREDITDTMIFSPSDLVTMICRDVDLNYATRGAHSSDIHRCHCVCSHGQCFTPVCVNRDECKRTGQLKIILPAVEFAICVALQNER